jgi:cell division transport system permease protein
MLGFKKNIKFEKQAMVVALKSIKNQPMLTLITGLMIGFILTWPTFLWVLSNQARSAMDNWHDKAFFTFYLPSSVGEQTKDDILQRLQSMQNLKSVKIISPQEALKSLLKNRDSKTVMALGLENPLPYVVEIQPNLSDFSPASLEDFYQKISQIPNLQGSKNNLSWFERLSAFERFLNRFTLLLVLILMIGVSFLVSNTLRMVIHSRYEEIQILKLVGATNQFIVSPFLYTGAFYGLLGAIFSVLTVDFSITYLQSYFQPLAALYDYAGQIDLISPIQMLVIAVFSLGLGWIAAWIFVRHYLNAIEPV